MSKDVLADKIAREVIQASRAFERWWKTRFDERMTHTKETMREVWLAARQDHKV